MKELKFKVYGYQKTVNLTKDILQRGIGILFILISAGLLGVFELFKWGWDWSILSNSEFWSGYFVRLAMLYIAFFGAYILKRSINLNNPKVIIQKQTIKFNRKLISDNFMTSHCEHWIENVNNYEEKLSIYKNYLDLKNASLNVVEPKQVTSNEKFQKIRQFIYNIKKKRYDKALKMRLELEKQLELVNKHLTVIEYYRQDKIEEAKALYKSFEKEDKFKYFMPNYKGLTYPKLFNVSMESKLSIKSVEYNEFSTISAKIIKTIGVGCILLAFLNAIVPELIKEIDYTTIIYIAFNILMLLWYVLNGILTANKFVFGNVLSADFERINICNKYRDDCIRNNKDWVKAFKSESTMEQEE